MSLVGYVAWPIQQVNDTRLVFSVLPHKVLFCFFNFFPRQERKKLEILVSTQVCSES